MIADIIVGMQYGSEGKGAFVNHALQMETGYNMSMRVQSTQSGHTIYFKNQKYIMRSIPCAWVNPNVELLLGPGAFTERDILLDEIKSINGSLGGDVRDRLFIDKRVFEVEDRDKRKEADQKLDSRIGSTIHGSGSALNEKIWRKRTRGNKNFIEWCLANKINVVDTIDHIQKGTLLIEGCQGAMLSIHTSPFYPYVTSREATASGILSECGISPRDVRNIFGVFRTLPIRVGGNSGPTGSVEITWEEVSRRAGYNVTPEKTSVTGRIRRIFEFSYDDMAHAIRVNKPTHLIMTFANYIAPCFGIDSWDKIDINSKRNIDTYTSVVNKLCKNITPNNTYGIVSINTNPINWIDI